MQLAPNWKAILTKAWSVRLMAVAGVLSGIEAAIATYPDIFAIFGVAPGRAALVSMTVTCCAMWVRILAQKGVTADAE